MLSELSQTDKGKYYKLSPTPGNWKIKWINIIKQKKTHIYREQSSGYQWRGNWGGDR